MSVHHTRAALCLLLAACNRDEPVSTTPASSSAPSSASAPAAEPSEEPIRVGPPSPMLEVRTPDGVSPKLLCFMSHRGDWVGRSRFALYEDGQVLFSRTATDRALSHSAQLTPQQTRALADRLITPAFLAISRGPDHRGSIGDGHIEILVRHEGRWKQSIFKRGHPMPRAFTQTLKVIQTFDEPTATPWVPETISVYFERATTAAPSVPWPRLLPSAHDRINVAKGFGGTEVESRHEPLIDELIADGKNVLVDGRPYQLTVERVVREADVVGAVRRAFWTWEARNERRRR